MATVRSNVASQQWVDYSTCARTAKKEILAQVPDGTRHQAFRVSLPRDECRKNRPLTGAHEVADNMPQLDIRIFERLLKALRVLRDLADQLLASPHQVLQRLDRNWGHEDAVDQTVGEQVGDPGRGAPVALPARHVANMLCVGQHEDELVVENVPHRLPVHPGRFHGHVRAPGIRQPRRQIA